MSKLDLLTIGEAVIDFIAEKETQSVESSDRYCKFTGGSPFNIANNVARLGFKTGLISRVGQDSFGKMIKNTMLKNGVAVKGLQWDQQSKTTVIFVSRGCNTPEVLHYRGADQNIEFSDYSRRLIDMAEIIHFSGFALSKQPTRNALIKMKNYALNKGKYITFDPCFHDVLWDNPVEGRKIFKKFIKDFEIIKPSIDDLERLWGKITYKEGIQKYHQLGAKNVILTLGEKGILISNGKEISQLDVKQVEAVDVTGAGDSFWSGLYSGLLLKKPFMEAVKLGVLTASITVQHLGALAPLPNIEQLVTQKECI